MPAKAGIFAVVVKLVDMYASEAYVGRLRGSSPLDSK